MGWLLCSINCIIYTFTYRPLLYGLQIKEDFKVLHSYAFESKDYQVTPGTPWNYALVLHNDHKPTDDLKFVSKRLNSTYPFSPDGAPSYIEAMVGSYTFKQHQFIIIDVIC